MWVVNWVGFESVAGDSGSDATDEVTTIDVDALGEVTKLGKAPPTFATPASEVDTAIGADKVELFDGAGRTRQDFLCTVPKSLEVTVMTCPHGSVPITLPGYPHRFLHVEGQVLLP